MAELSVIVPYVREWPQILFTLQSIHQELRDRVDFEVIAADNYCEEVMKQGSPPDRGHSHYVHAAHKGKMWAIYDRTVPNDAAVQMSHLKAMATRNDWLKYVHYDKKLSHWNAKRVAVEQSTGKFLLFIDSHCVVSRDSIFKMFTFYRQEHENINGTVHLPLTYHILETKRLIYKLCANRESGDLHYAFTPFRESKKPYEVPCMSTCGMIMARWIYDKLGGWPEQLGVYGGGENFINFTLASLGMSKWIYPTTPLFHHGDRRGYHWYGDDYQRNRMIATYLAAGRNWLDRLVEKSKKGHPSVRRRMADRLLVECAQQREYIRAQVVCKMEDWLDKWQ